MQLEFYPAAFEYIISPTMNVVAFLYATTIIVGEISSGHSTYYII
jgi:hypothetical protein